NLNKNTEILLFYNEVLSLRVRICSGILCIDIYFYKKVDNITPLLYCVCTIYTHRRGNMIALEVKDLNKKYENFSLQDVSFQLEQGYIMGFIGANGAGKTNTIKYILNMSHLASGEVSIMSKNMVDE